MTTIVYHGSGEGGNLFAGTKFFFMQRLPSRQTWIDLVKVFMSSRESWLILILQQANGGEIVKIDKHAHIIIADHALKGCPPGSISWKYIQESVRDGELKNIEMYRAAPSAQTPRVMGSGEPRKQGRTPFTAEDDRVLTKWVLEAERQGISTKGNEIYKQLEAKVRLIALAAYLFPLTGAFRTHGILPRHGATVGSSMSPTTLDQNPRMNLLDRHQEAMDLLLERISLIKDLLFDLRHFMSAHYDPVGAQSQEVSLLLKPPK
jgi:hypothetical protein